MVALSWQAKAHERLKRKRGEVDIYIIVRQVIALEALALFLETDIRDVIDGRKPNLVSDHLVGQVRPWYRHIMPHVLYERR